MYKTVLYECGGAVATITLNRPDAGNTFTPELFADVDDAVERAGADRQVRAVIITGAGKHFSLGGDVKAMESMNFLTPELMALAGKMSGNVRKCPKPVIAKINGVAAGAGLSLALACDFRVMGEKSALMTAFINMALPGDTGCFYHMYHIVGLAKTLELMMLSAQVGGAEALRLGLATRLAPDGQLDDVTQQLADALKAQPTAAIAQQKQIAWATLYHDFEAYLTLEGQSMTDAEKTADHAQAVTAFFAKRKPVFLGE